MIATVPRPYFGFFGVQKLDRREYPGICRAGLEVLYLIPSSDSAEPPDTAANRRR